MDKFCHYINSIDKNNISKSNGSIFFINHSQKTYLLTAAHTLRKFNEPIYPDFNNWQAKHLELLNKDRIPLYNNDLPLFSYFPLNDKELLDAVMIPVTGCSSGQVDYSGGEIGENIKLCGWRRSPDITKFIYDGKIIDKDGWHLLISLNSIVERNGISGGGVYTDKGFIGVYYADDIDKKFSHAVSINYMLLGD